MHTGLEIVLQKQQIFQEIDVQNLWQWQTHFNVVGQHHGETTPSKKH
jgi:hypothetical protein